MSLTSALALIQKFYFSAPFGKRSWKMFFCTLRDLVLYLHKDEHGFNKKQVSNIFFNCISIEFFSKEKLFV